jgi:hypothetical protein
MGSVDRQASPQVPRLRLMGGENRTGTASADQWEAFPANLPVLSSDGTSLRGPGPARLAPVCDLRDGGGGCVVGEETGRSGGDEGGRGWD